MIAGAPPEITVPAGAAQLTDLESRSMLWLFVTGRLNVGKSIEQGKRPVTDVLAQAARRRRSHAEHRAETAVLPRHVIPHRPGSRRQQEYRSPFQISQAALPALRHCRADSARRLCQSDKSHPGTRQRTPPRDQYPHRSRSHSMAGHSTTPG
jgi:hypothetical protein